MKQHSLPVKIADGKTEHLFNVSLGSREYDESWIQDICYDNPGILLIAEIEQTFINMKEHGWETVLSAEEIMRAVFEPLVLLQGEYPKMVATPTCVNQSYLDISRMLGLPDLKQNMTLTQFRASTKLDLDINLKQVKKNLIG